MSSAANFDWRFKGLSLKPQDRLDTKQQGQC